MFKFICTVMAMGSLCALPIYAQTDNTCPTAWEAFEKQQFTEAAQQFEKAFAQPNSALDAALGLISIHTLEGNERKARPYFEKLLSVVDDPQPYLYAIWFNEAALGDYSKKDKETLSFMDKLSKNPKIEGTLQAALTYQKSFHFLRTNDMAAARKEWQKMGAIDKWQFVGAFPNISGSGFDKDYAPIQKPKTEEKFISKNDAEISWFAPNVPLQQGWVFVGNFITESGIHYAQSFVNAPQDMEVILAVGAGGSLKVWVNDKLAITSSEERTTELDTYRATCKLRKGYNRILVQLGHNNTSYSNFIARIVDTKMFPIQGLTYSANYQDYPKESGSYDTSLPLFAENYFEQKIKQYPNNITYGIFLCETYLRNQKHLESQRLLRDLLKKYPNNLYIHWLKLRALKSSTNRTAHIEQIAFIREKYPTSLPALSINLTEAIEDEKYEEADKILATQIQRYGENRETMEKQISLLSYQNKNEELLVAIAEARKKYPEDETFLRMDYNILSQVSLNPQAAIKLYEKYIKHNFSVTIWEELAGAYFKQGANNKGVDILEKLYSYFPEETRYVNEFANYYYGLKNYNKALEYAKQATEITPYSSTAWETIGYLEELLHDKEGTRKAFQTSLKYNPNNYTLRRRLRLLNEEPDLLDYLPKAPLTDLMKDSSMQEKSLEYGWYYIFDEKNRIVYTGGASEEHCTQVIKIVNEKGIDYWKEASLGYNPYNQRLIIETAEILKPNGKRTKAEKNNSDFVFVNLQKGDVIIIKYKIENYYYGRFARDFFDTHYFDYFVPCNLSRFNLLVPKDKKFAYKISQGTLEPTIQDKGEFKLYTWERTHTQLDEYENSMPAFSDISQVLHTSSVASWDDIMNWYSDVSSEQAKADFQIKELYQELFPNGHKGLSEYERARIIYDYIVKNISYSSVSFRQSAYVPQKASATLDAHLGDCKDVSTLYAALAQEAELQVNLVLISSRDNGEKELLLPNLGFDHCIVKVMADSKPYYLELTNSRLPFSSVPNTLRYSQALEIPWKKHSQNAQLTPLKAPNRLLDAVERVIDIRIDKMDMYVDIKSVKKGSFSADTRHSYYGLTKDQQKKNMQSVMKDCFKNPLEVTDVSFPSDEDILKLQDTIAYGFTGFVKNEILEINDLKAFKIPYVDELGKAEHFNDSKARKHTFCYWKYENADYYSQKVNVTIPSDKAFADLPSNVKYQQDGFSYSIEYKKISPNKIQILRSIQIPDNLTVSPSNYEKFRTSMQDAIQAESKYILFK